MRLRPKDFFSREEESEKKNEDKKIKAYLIIFHFRTGIENVVRVKVLLFDIFIMDHRIVQVFIIIGIVRIRSFDIRQIRQAAIAVVVIITVRRFLETLLPMQMLQHVLVVAIRMEQTTQNIAGIVALVQLEIVLISVALLFAQLFAPLQHRDAIAELIFHHKWMIDPRGIGMIRTGIVEPDGRLAKDVEIRLIGVGRRLIGRLVEFTDTRHSQIAIVAEIVDNVEGIIEDHWNLSTELRL